MCESVCGHRDADVGPLLACMISAIDCVPVAGASGTPLSMTNRTYPRLAEFSYLVADLAWLLMW